MRNLFDEGDIRASSDRYLRNAIIAVLAHDRARDAVGRGPAAVGHARRATPSATASARTCAGLPEFKEIGDFFTEELARPAARRARA